jgi:hypothetical protein
MIDKPLKSSQLLQVARATLQKGDRNTAKEMAVLAMRSDDAVQALDRLLPKLPEPGISAEELEMSPEQIASITALARTIKATQHQKIVTAILGRLERIEAAQAAQKLTRVTAVPVKYQNVNLKPPVAVQAAAKRGLELRKKFERGGTDVAVARARDIAAGRQLSISTVRRMNRFFDSAEKGEKRDDTASIVWALWGGDAAAKWSTQVCAQLDKADKKP